MTDLSTPQRAGGAALSDEAPASRSPQRAGLSERPEQSAQSGQRARPARLRFVTAAALFDGHDASINIIRRMLQASGVEVIHLGHNRSVEEVATAALQEDADGVAVSSYQGGHVEYFR